MPRVRELRQKIKNMKKFQIKQTGENVKEEKKKQLYSQ